MLPEQGAYDGAGVGGTGAGVGGTGAGVGGGVATGAGVGGEWRLALVLDLDFHRMLEGKKTTL